MTFFYSTDKYNLDELEINILKYLRENINDIKRIGVRQVAKDNFTSTATIYKLVKKLGFDGYADMAYSMYYDHISNDLCKNSSSPYENIKNSINHSKNEFLNLIEKYREKQIIVTGMGFSQIVADYISESLFLKGFNITSKLHIQFLDRKYSNDILLIVISQSGDTQRLVEIVKQAKDNNIDVITFTGSENNKLSAIASLPVKIRTNPNFKNESNLFCGESIIAFELMTQDI